MCAEGGVQHELRHLLHVVAEGLLTSTVLGACSLARCPLVLLALLAALLRGVERERSDGEHERHDEQLQPVPQGLSRTWRPPRFLVARIGREARPAPLALVRQRNDDRRGYRADDKDNQRDVLDTAWSHEESPPWGRAGRATRSRAGPGALKLAAAGGQGEPRMARVAGALRADLREGDVLGERHRTTRKHRRLGNRGSDGTPSGRC